MADILSRIFDTCAQVLSGLSSGQFAALIIFIVAISLAIEVAKKGLSICLSGLGFLAALYFVAPEIYQAVIAFVSRIFSQLA